MLRRVRDLWLDYVVVGVVFLASYLSILATRPQFVPDSQYYLGMSLWYGGLSQEDAHARVEELGIPAGFRGPDVEMMFGWGLVQPRVVLPALAAPLVRLLGPTGLAVTTGIITIILVLVLHEVLLRRFGRGTALAVVVLMLCSSFLMFFNAAMLTESLSALFGVLSLVAAWQYQRDRSVQWLVVLGVITAFSAFTRQATFIVAAAFIVAWLLSLVIRRADRGWGMPALVVGVVAVGLQIVQTIAFPTFSQAQQFERATGTSSLWEAIAAAPGLLFRIVKAELLAFMTDDLALLVIIALALLSVVVFWQRSESHLLVGALLGIGLYNITNGTATGFRYAIPGLVFFVVSVAILARYGPDRAREISEHFARRRPAVPVE
jgi:hypothetical protein